LLAGNRGEASLDVVRAGEKFCDEFPQHVLHTLIADEWAQPAIALGLGPQFIDIHRPASPIVRRFATSDLDHWSLAGNVEHGDGLWGRSLVASLSLNYDSITMNIPALFSFNQSTWLMICHQEYPIAELKVKILLTVPCLSGDAAGVLWAEAD
jgi:hypothetical protein